MKFVVKHSMFISIKECREYRRGILEDMQS
jgi:hypothetical protein